MTNPHHLPAMADTDKAMQTSRPNLLARPKSVSEARVMLRDRLKESEALKLVAVMLSTRARQAGEPPDGSSYVKSLAGRLMVEPRNVAIACCDPVHGLLMEIFVKPTIADIARWCARASAEMHLMVADDDRRWREESAREVDRSNRESIDEMRARLGPTFGLRRVPTGGLGVRDDDAGDDEEAAAARRREQAAAALEHSNRMIAADYARLGIAPVSSCGMLHSPSLLASLGRLPAKSKGKRSKRAKEEA